MKRLNGSAQDQTLVTAIIQMAKGLNLTTIAEGTEDEATRARLAQMGCDQAQGYWFSKPLTPKAFWDYANG